VRERGDDECERESGHEERIHRQKVVQEGVGRREGANEPGRLAHERGGSGSRIGEWLRDLYSCVAGTPGAVPITSTHALTNTTAPFVLRLANEGVLPETAVR
jgi:Alanine dehydrogenase/PNT, C-terminal domain